MPKRTITLPKQIDEKLVERKEKTGESVSSQVKRSVARELGVIE